MIKSKAIISTSSFLSMFFLGIGITIIGATARNIGLTPFQIGLLIIVQNLGFGISVIITGALADSYEKPKILFIGSIILALSFFFFFRLSNSFFINCIIMFFIGVGIGSYEGVTDAMLLDIHKKREAFYININHFFVTFGSIIITTYLIFLNMNWRDSLLQSSICVFVLAIIFIMITLKVKKSKTIKFSERLKILTQKKGVVILFFITAIAAGLEMEFVGIITTFLMNLKNFSETISKIGLILFFSGIAAGRILIGIFSKKRLISLFLLLLCGSSTILLIGLLLVEINILVYALIFLCGITFSAVLPLAITLAGLLYKDIAGTVIGVLKIAIPIGGIIIPFIFSILAKYFSFNTSLFLLPAFTFLTFIIILLNKEKLNLPDS